MDTTHTGEAGHTAKWKPQTLRLVVVQDERCEIGPTAGTQGDHRAVDLTAAHGSQIFERSVGNRYVFSGDNVVDDLVKSQGFNRISPRIAGDLDSDHLQTEI
jgi:hypothetical protein